VYGQTVALLHTMYLDKFGIGGLNKNFPVDFNLGPVFGKKEL